MDQKWPQEIWLVRHGKAPAMSRDAAEAASGLSIDIADSDVDVPLSALGVRQSAALAGWFAAMPAAAQPNVVLHSPYLRAAETARIVKRVIDPDSMVAATVDERLREKEFGILDRLTTHGVAQRYPDLYRQRKHVGKFYFRPPGGESWCDVILRLRSVLDTITREYARERPHRRPQVTVNCLLPAERQTGHHPGDAPATCPTVRHSCSHPARGKRGKLVPDLVNFVAPLEAAGTPVTVSKDVPAAPKA
jgi:broad specificity phosphatase PhoE